MVAIRQEGGEAGAEGTVEARRERGRAARQKVPRGAHEAIGNVDRDPVELLEISSHGRVERLVPLRYGRVIQSPFAFYRGSAIIQAHDLAGTADSGLHMQICGDCHLANFGGFATPERALLFDLNDFDETSPGPWEWDLKRLCASFVVAARHLQHKAGVAEAVVREAVGSYQRRMLAYAEMGMLDQVRGKPRPLGRRRIARTPSASFRGLMRRLLLLNVLADDLDGRTAAAPCEVRRRPQRTAP
ncbi:DUF2252 family protein [Cupriavidus necator]|nr:DUF2252 family protein [Cupriavidus necator]MDX6011601.1 DUF2252 family protein [Cupriavidus necator]